MQVSKFDLADLSYFLAVAKRKSFTRAATDLGVTSSALSHSLKLFEQRLGLLLLHRTTRSVTLTAAGEQLFRASTSPMSELAVAFEELNRFRDSPAGLIRLNVPADAANYLLAPVIPKFVENYPDVELEVAITNTLVDVINGGFDAGIRYDDSLPQDMVAQRLSAPIRWLVAASPIYLSKHGSPATPQDIAAHRCLKIRSGTGRIFDWEFQRRGRSFTVSTPGSVTIDDSSIALRLSVAGMGLVYGPEYVLTDYVSEGSLTLLLEEYAVTSSGLYAYYASNRQIPAGLSALIGYIRQAAPLGM